MQIFSTKRQSKLEQVCEPAVSEEDHHQLIISTYRKTFPNMQAAASSEGGRCDKTIYCQEVYHTSAPAQVNPTSSAPPFSALTSHRVTRMLLSYVGSKVSTYQTMRSLNRACRIRAETTTLVWDHAIPLPYQYHEFVLRQPSLHAGAALHSHQHQVAQQLGKAAQLARSTPSSDIYHSMHAMVADACRRISHHLHLAGVLENPPFAKRAHRPFTGVEGVKLTVHTDTAAAVCAHSHCMTLSFGSIAVAVQVLTQQAQLPPHPRAWNQTTAIGATCLTKRKYRKQKKSLLLATVESLSDEKVQRDEAVSAHICVQWRQQYVHAQKELERPEAGKTTTEGHSRADQNETS